MKSTVQIGELNKEVFFKMPTFSRDNTGDSIEKWVTSSARWAKIETSQAASDEKEMSGKKTDVNTVVISMYYNEGVMPTWRVLHGSREYEILSILPDEDEFFMEIEATLYDDN